MFLWTGYDVGMVFCAVSDNGMSMFQIIVKAQEVSIGVFRLSA